MTSDPLTPPTPVLEPAVSPRVRNAIAAVITTIWAAGVIADAGLANFELSVLVHSMMAGLAASIFGSSFVKGIR